MGGKDLLLFLENGANFLLKSEELLFVFASHGLFHSVHVIPYLPSFLCFYHLFDFNFFLYSLLSLNRFRCISAFLYSVRSLFLPHREGLLLTVHLFRSLPGDLLGNLPGNLFRRLTWEKSLLLFRRVYYLWRHLILGVLRLEDLLKVLGILRCYYLLGCFLFFDYFGTFNFLNILTRSVFLLD